MGYESIIAQQAMNFNRKNAFRARRNAFLKREAPYGSDGFPEGRSSKVVWVGLYTQNSSLIPSLEG